MKKENLYLIHGEDYLRHIEEKLELFWISLCCSSAMRVMSSSLTSGSA